jgi:pimeloyl-ACP methyl ester carboxylesterase
MWMRSRASIGCPALALVGGVVAAIAGATARRYRRDLRAAVRRQATVHRNLLRLSVGQVEYAEKGDGEPLLVSHGIFEGCGAGLHVRDLFPDRRVIVPSRFGYGESSLPYHASPAMQADAFVELLDALGVRRADLVGVSAGATSALQLALRHPDRVKHLVVLSGNLPGGPTAVVQPAWARFVNRQIPVWILKTFFPSTMAFMAGVPRRLGMSRADARFVAAFLDSLFPITPNVEGIDFDAFVSNADVNDYDLEDVAVSTTIVHAKDDPLASYDSAERAAARIPGARLVSVETGGHLLLGRSESIRHELGRVLRESST